MRAPDRPSAFADERAGDRFRSVYDRFLATSWPVPVDAVDVTTRSGVTRVYRAGRTGDDPVVLLAGAGANALSWYRHVEPLARHHHVVAVDPLGEPGRSVQTRAIAGGAQLGDWLADVLAGIGAERAHVVGSSAGAWTALEHQAAGHGRVERLTLLDPAGLAPLTARFYRWIVLSGVAGMLPRPLRHRAADRLVNGMLRDDALMPLVLAGARFRRRLPGPPGLTDEQLHAVTVPVQVLLGGRSALHDARAVAARLSRAVPGWTVEVVPDAGHALPLEAPDLVVRRILEPLRR